MKLIKNLERETVVQSSIEIQVYRVTILGDRGHRDSHVISNTNTYGNL